MVVQFDTELEEFLSHDVEIKRSSGFTVNDYGEVIPSSETVSATTTIRIEPASSKNLTTMIQGKEVIITHKGFAKSTEDVRINDKIKVVGLTTEYVIVLVNPLYDKTTLDHYELLLKEVSTL